MQAGGGRLMKSFHPSPRCSGATFQSAGFSAHVSLLWAERAHVSALWARAVGGATYWDADGGAAKRTVNRLPCGGHASSSGECRVPGVQGYGACTEKREWGGGGGVGPGGSQAEPR
jgi:hypothetical protein